MSVVAETFGPERHAANRLTAPMTHATHVRLGTFLESLRFNRAILSLLSDPLLAGNGRVLVPVAQKSPPRFSTTTEIKVTSTAANKTWRVRPEVAFHSPVKTPKAFDQKICAAINRAKPTEVP